MSNAMFLTVIWKFIKSVATFIMANWKYILVGTASAFLVYQMQQFRISNLKDTLIEKQAEIKDLTAANQSNVLTIDKLKIEVANINKSCTSRLQAKEKIIKELRDIDNLKIGGKDNEGKNPSGDAVFDALNSMFKPTNR